MTVFELFSQRRSRQAGHYPPKPTKRVFSRRLRDALYLTLVRCIGRFDTSYNTISGPFLGNNLWNFMNETLLMQSDEYHGFPFGAHSRVGDRIYEYFVGASEVGFIDVLDLAVAVIYGGADNLHQSTDGYEHGQFGISLGSTAALQQMDELLRRNGTVFRIADGKVIVSTDDFAHENAIVPALTALGLAGFENALREFHGALTDHRNGEYADALTKANHAFESTMKVIASKMGWSHKETATAKNLIEVMVNNGLVPAMRESALTGLRLMLESDVPTLRNKTPSAGHGAGVQRAAVPEPYVTYAINAAASNIRLLVELYHMKRQEK